MDRRIMKTLSVLRPKMYSYLKMMVVFIRKQRVPGSVKQNAKLSFMITKIVWKKMN